MKKIGEVSGQLLNECGVNPFAMTLLVESFEKLDGGLSFCYRGKKKLVRVTLEIEPEPEVKP